MWVEWQTAQQEGLCRNILKNYPLLTRAKGGAIGMAAAGVVALAAMFALSQQTQAADISNTRLFGWKELSSTIKQTPGLISVKALSLKNTYGVDMVASVLYEHQEVLPELTKAIKLFESAESRQISSDLALIFRAFQFRLGK